MSTHRPSSGTLIWTVAKKELRGFFGSAVGVVFLAAFLLAVMFSFFWLSSFFTRGVADVRPLFDKMPLLLIFLVSALSMRVWSEEQRAGTIEVLMTLPVTRVQLVVGKFVAGMLLVALALLLTFGIPLTVSQMGNLDWGPVWGGYLAALLLAAAYLAIGMCVSAATDSQIVALLGTMLVCLLFWLPGSDAVVDLTGRHLGSILRAIGSGARFESIARGVLDLRDLAYYAGIVVAFLGINVLLLARRRWSTGPRTRPQRTGAIIATVLVAANALMLSVWLAPVSRARIDLTENGEYSLSSTTKKLLHGLDQPLLIRAYFSEKTHPKLAQLVPKILDLLEEYRISGGNNVRVEVVDPSKDDAAIAEAKDAYGIESIPVPFASRTEQSWLNVYFHILVQYGDQYEVLTFNDLIYRRPVGNDDVEVGLKNFEYDLTKTVKKVATGFQNLEAMFASMPGKVELTTYVTPVTLPADWKAAPAMLAKVIDELKATSSGKLSVTAVEPTTEAAQEELFQKYGMQGYRGDVFSKDVFYFSIIVKIGDRLVPIGPPEELTEASLKTAVTDGIKRAMPGFTKVVGIWSPPPLPPQPPQMQGMQPQQLPPPQQFKQLAQTLATTYEVREVDLTSGQVANDIDTLIVAGPSGLSEAEAKALDQYLMTGGAMIILDGRYRIDLIASGQNLAVEEVKTGLEDLLGFWGITVAPQMVLDTQSESFPMPIERDFQGTKIRQLQKVEYPYFVKVSGDEMASGSPIVGGVPSVTVHYASPVTVGEAAPVAGAPPRKATVLLRSSANSWLDNKTMVMPDDRGVVKRPTGLSADKLGAQPLAVSIVGGFPSFTVSKETSAGSDAGSNGAKGASPFSPPDARLLVVGSSAFVSDDLLGLGAQTGSTAATDNLQFLQNAVDWAMADTDLLSIRAHSSSARALTLPESKRVPYEITNYLLALFGLGIVVLISWLRRRNVKAYELPKEAS